VQLLRLLDENGLVNRIYFQDDVMRFEKFPELFMIDATCKLNELRLPLIIIMKVDGNGASVDRSAGKTWYMFKQKITFTKVFV
jgi:hypothetical protein